MNRSKLFQSNGKRLYLIFFSGFLCLSAFSNWQTAQTQVNPLRLVQVMNGLQTEEVTKIVNKRPKKFTLTLADRNAILIEGVKKQRVAFILTPEIEKELKDLGASAELLEAIRQNGPKPPTPTPTPTPTPPNFSFYQKRADDWASKGDYDRAIADYDEAIRLNPQNAASFYNRGIAYHYKNNAERALEDYKNAARLNSELAAQPQMVCLSYSPAVNPDQAIEACGKIISRSADFALVYYVRGNAYFDKKDFDRAIADFTKFIELNPKDVRAYIKRADSYFVKKDFDLAAADYNRAIEMEANNEPAKNGLQKIQAEKANIAKAPASSPEEKVNLPPIVDIGALNNRAVRLKTPMYPADARKIGAQGRVEVKIVLDEQGNVITARAVSGSVLFYAAAEAAARGSKFQPVLVNNQPVKASGFLIYNFKRER